ncbi:hypothetical protein G6F57_022172 [Rhizopus arrhizus]|nr:hypothetical protein G6F57_022172 [Rhizopus arrhizus]
MIKMTQAFQKVAAIRGMNDVLPGPSARWEQFEEIVRGWLRGYGYRNVHVHLHRRIERRIADDASRDDGRHRARLDRAQHALRPPATRLLDRPRLPPRAPAARPLPPVPSDRRRGPGLCRA